MDLQVQRGEAVARFWPILAALLSGLFLGPLIAAAFAFVMAVVRRHDRLVLIGLVVVGVLWLGFWASMAFGYGSGESTGGLPVG